MTNGAISQPWKEAEGTKAEKKHYSHGLSQHGKALGGHTFKVTEWVGLGQVGLG